jgi:hypothetical protein
MKFIVNYYNVQELYRWLKKDASRMIKIIMTLHILLKLHSMNSHLRWLTYYFHSQNNEKN